MRKKELVKIFLMIFIFIGSILFFIENVRGDTEEIYCKYGSPRCGCIEHGGATTKNILGYCKGDSVKTKKGNILYYPQGYIGYNIDTDKCDKCSNNGWITDKQSTQKLREKTSGSTSPQSGNDCSNGMDPTCGTGKSIGLFCKCIGRERYSSQTSTTPFGYKWECYKEEKNEHECYNAEGDISPDTTKKESEKKSKDTPSTTRPKKCNQINYNSNPVGSDNCEKDKETKFNTGLYCTCTKTGDWLCELDKIKCPVKPEEEAQSKNLNDCLTNAKDYCENPPSVEVGDYNSCYNKKSTECQKKFGVQPLTSIQADCEKNCIANPNFADNIEGSSGTKAFLVFIKGKEILPLVNAECGYLSDEKENNSYNIGYLIGKILSGKLN